MRDFQQHSSAASAAASGSESHTRLLQQTAEDDDYGQLYVEEEDGGGLPLYDYGADFGVDLNDEVPGPAPEIDPPHPAPPGRLKEFYKSTTARITRSNNYRQDYQIIDGFQQPPQSQSEFNLQQSEVINDDLLVNRDLNDNYNADNQQQQPRTTTTATTITTNNFVGQQQMQQQPQEQQQQLVAHLGKQEYWKWNNGGVTSGVSMLPRPQNPMTSNLLAGSANNFGVHKTNTSNSLMNHNSSYNTYNSMLDQTTFHVRHSKYI